MEVTNDASAVEPVVRIQKQGELKEVDIPLSEFLKIVLSGLPITDNVNDEMRIANGDVYIPSSLIIAPPVVKEATVESSTTSVTA